MKRKDIAILLDEPARTHPKPGKSGCAKPKPGATAGGCAFDGAQIALLPIADVAHIVHGSIACAGNSWDNRGTRSSGPSLYRIGMTTDLTEQDVVMGRSEQRLLHAIRQAIDSYHPAAVFVYNTCVPALIGDDLEAVCKEAQGRWGTPVVPVDGAGFYGTKNLGNRIAGDTMVKYVCGGREPDPLPAGSERPGFKVHDVALVGEYNIAGELWHVLPLLDELGLRVLCALSGDARFREVQTMHRSEVNMMVCSKAMLNVARKLEAAFGTPWFEGSFYGVKDVSQALRDFARLIGDPDLTKRTERLIAREEARIDDELVPWRERLAGRKALLYTGGVKSWSIVAALQDLGMEVVATGTKKSTGDDKARIQALMGRDAMMIEDGNPRVLLEIVREHQVDVLIAGGRNMYTALKARLPFLDVNQERDFGYAGYTGMLELARQLCLTIESPVWAAIRQPAPWARGSAPEHGVATAPHPVQDAPRAEIVKRRKALSVNPLKASPTIGAALAFLGFRRCIPMLHGSQGCAAFGKVFFVRHFREPIPLQTTAMDQGSAVMGANENLVEGLKTLCQKHAPELIGVPTTGLVETQGTDIRMAVRMFRDQYPQLDAIPVVPVATPDFTGSLESGYALAVAAVIGQLVPRADAAGTRPGRRPRQVNLLVGAHLTPGDLEYLKDLIERFGLHPIVLPDLSDSLDGHLTEQDFSPLTMGGAQVADLAVLGDSAATLVVGASLDAAADLLAERTGVPDARFPHLMGLAAVDALVTELARISATPVPAQVERQRSQLQDAMLDTHFMLGRSRFALAADADLLVGFSDLLASLGAETVAAVAPTNTPALERVRTTKVEIGDLEDLERTARERGAEVLIGNSHAAPTAERSGLPLLRAGFPLYDQVGGYQRLWIGYPGTRRTLFDLANILLSLERGEIRPYHSRLSPKSEKGWREGDTQVTCNLEAVAKEAA
ncbi:nitrogenase iron-molybdenum cofactor biosynthesis protein NifE [Candidatus Thiosymbion oneisti]|uniref:nitrogenase iron-molybdenum cofactor biosynthesis protein NifE n=1 Tax=Candidatus Thiosymbion oneisti TaxID=589554 RepID=UPI000ABAC516